MAKTLIIEDNSPEAKKLLAYIQTLPFVTVVNEKKRVLPQLQPLVMLFR